MTLLEATFTFVSAATAGTRLTGTKCTTAVRTLTGLQKVMLCISCIFPWLLDCISISYVLTVQHALLCTADTHQEKCRLELSVSDFSGILLDVLGQGFYVCHYCAQLGVCSAIARPEALVKLLLFVAEATSLRWPSANRPAR